MTRKILLLGNQGQVGWELYRTLITLGDLTTLDYPQIDMSNPLSIQQVVRQTKPGIIVNATAYTDVDQAEQEPSIAMVVNGTGPGVLAEEAKKLNAGLIHFSTDYVFDGTKSDLYTEADSPNPINEYGRTKLAGEQVIQQISGVYLILRTSWVYSLRRPCFVTKVLQWARAHEVLRIVDDQVSNPTWARALAEVVGQIIASSTNVDGHWLSENIGLYHLAGVGSCSRYEWAKAILALDPDREAHIIKEILPASSGDFITLAKRPSRSALSSEKLYSYFGLSCAPWKDALSLLWE